jgi:hypothetical protein
MTAPGIGVRSFNGILFGYYAFSRTKSDAHKLVNLLKKQDVNMKYRIVKQRYADGMHYLVYTG